MTRILGVDIGEKRVGVAISDELGIAAHPLETIAQTTDEALIEKLKASARENGVTRIVVGLPLNMNGSLGDSANKILDFVERLKEKTGLDVVTWDERLTSVEAEKLLLGLDKSRKKRKTLSDEVAAVLILQAYMSWSQKKNV